MINAQGEAEARYKIVEAEAKAIRMIKAKYRMATLSLFGCDAVYKALPELTKGSEGKTVVIPYEMGSLVGSLASMQQIFTNLK